MACGAGEPLHRFDDAVPRPRVLRRVSVRCRGPRRSPPTTAGLPGDHRRPSERPQLRPGDDHSADHLSRLPRPESARRMGGRSRRDPGRGSPPEWPDSHAPPTTPALPRHHPRQPGPRATSGVGRRALRVPSRHMALATGSSTSPTASALPPTTRSAKATGTSSRSSRRSSRTPTSSSLTSPQSASTPSAQTASNERPPPRSHTES